LKILLKQIEVLKYSFIKEDPMKEIIFIMLFLLVATIAFSERIDSPKIIDQPDVSFAMELVASLALTQSVGCNLLLERSQEEYLIGYRYSAGVIKAKEVQLSMNHFSSEQRRGFFTGVMIGYADYKEISLIYSSQPLRRINKIEIAARFGYAINKRLRGGIEIGNLPGIVSLNLGYKFGLLE